MVAMASMSVTDSTHDPHRALRDDVRLLGELLGETLRRQEGQPLFERVERVRALAKRTRVSSADGFETLAGELRAMPVESALPIARSFAHFLNLANVAEQHHRVRRRRAYQRDPRARPQPASIEEALPRLLSSGVVARRPAPRRLQPRHRARRDRPSDRDHAPVAAAQVPADRRRAGRPRPRRRHLSRARDARRDACGARSPRRGRPKR